MITILYSTGSSLPDNRVDLYREIFQVLLYRRRDAIGLTPKLNVQQKLEILQSLALHMLQRHLLEIENNQLNRVITPHLTRIAPEITPTEFLKDIAQNSGLFLEITNGTWGFAHKTLQEYLTATYLKERRNRESVLLNHINDDWWHETICFYCAQTDATKIIQSCLAQADTSLPLLNLALACNNQKLKADAVVTQQIEELLQKGIEDANPTKRQIVAEALLKRRLESMVYLHDNVYMDTSLVSCVEYQLFLDDQSAQGGYYHPLHWTSETFQAEQGREPLLGVQPSDALVFCEWLTTRDTGLWQYRLPHKDELEQILSHLKMAGLSRRAVGFWTEDHEFVWLNGEAPEYENLGEMALDQLLLDRAQALAFDRVRASSNQDDDIDKLLKLERALNDTHVPDISTVLAPTTNIHPLDLLSVEPITSGYISANQVDLLYNNFIESFSRYIFFFKDFFYASHIEARKQISWFIRYGVQLQIRHLYAQLMKQQQHQSPVHENIHLFRSMLGPYLRICTPFILLELRTRGKLPPWEGILLVKEHKVEGSDGDSGGG